MNHSGEFCSLHKMFEGSVYTRSVNLSNTSKTFLMRGKNISRYGTIVNLEVAVDVTDIKTKA